jgi:hypothetical protein
LRSSIAAGPAPCRVKGVGLASHLGTAREKLLELFGPNGLDRLEALEAVENAQRASAAKVIEHRAEESVDG